MNEKELNTLITPNTTIGEIVAANYHAAGVFQRFGMDFCCGGGISLEKACEKRDTDMKSLIAALQTVEKQVIDNDENFQSWEPGFLIDHIIQNHHRFVRTKTEEISVYAEKVARVHGERHPENVAIFEKFSMLSQELLTHLEAEEERVFPLIRTIYESRMKGKNVPDELIGSLKAELNQMEDDHVLAGDTMKEIRELSNQFTPPAEACRTYQILYLNLEGFEQDLHKHVHLENNILFKKAEQLV
tara:strand:+ start:12101 stop:12832 length:732 start_codon:yes stop_codon:yes gene_type:complete